MADNKLPIRLQGGLSALRAAQMHQSPFNKPDGTQPEEPMRVTGPIQDLSILSLSNPAFVGVDLSQCSFRVSLRELFIGPDGLGNARFRVEVLDASGCVVVRLTQEAKLGVGDSMTFQLTNA